MVCERRQGRFRQAHIAAGDGEWVVPPVALVMFAFLAAQFSVPPTDSPALDAPAALAYRLASTLPAELVPAVARDGHLAKRVP